MGRAPKENEKVFQPSIFRCEMLVSRRVIDEHRWNVAMYLWIRGCFSLNLRDLSLLPFSRPFCKNAGIIIRRWDKFIVRLFSKKQWWFDHESNLIFDFKKEPFQILCFSLVNQWILSGLAEFWKSVAKQHVAPPKFPDFLNQGIGRKTELMRAYWGSSTVLWSAVG